MLRRSSARHRAATVVAALVLLGVSACGSSGGSSAAATSSTGDPTTTRGAGAAGSGPTSGTGSTSSGGADPGGTGPGAPTTASGGPQKDGYLPYDGPGGRGPCSPDADRLSGTSTVMWTADSASKHKNSEATATTTFRIQEDGSMTPRTLTVKVGQVFAFALEEGVSDVVSIKVGCDSGQTVLAGDPVAGEYITKAGTYDVVNVVTNEQVGTITAA